MEDSRELGLEPRAGDVGSESGKLVDLKCEVDAHRGITVICRIVNGQVVDWPLGQALSASRHSRRDEQHQAA